MNHTMNRFQVTLTIDTESTKNNLEDWVVDAIQQNLDGEEQLFDVVIREEVAV